MIPSEYIVTETHQHQRLDLLLTVLQPEYSRSQIQKWIKSGVVTVNNKQVKANHKCAADEVIRWTVPNNESVDLQPEAIPLDIIYEDEDLLVVNKPKGMVVHPCETYTGGTLVNALLHHTRQLSTVGGEQRLGIVHRIDKDTSGLLVVAKTNDAHISLSDQFRKREVERIYEAIVKGVIEPESGLIDAPIGRDPNNRLRMGVVDQGKSAITHFQVVERFENNTHVLCQLETGRTHQIRVHMAYIGHPLVGDPKYSRKHHVGFDGQALFAKKLGFMHPKKHAWQQFEIQRPAYFNELLKEIKTKP